MSVQPGPSSAKRRAMQTGIGFCSGVIVSAVFQPLEVFKMTIILSPKARGSLQHNLNTYFGIVYNQHGLKGFWNGLTPAIIRNSIGNTLYFVPLRIFEEKFALSPFVASGCARIVSCASINPFTVLETRFVVPGPRKHKNVLSAIKTLNREQGFKVFWKGTLPSCVKEGIFAGIYYKLYKVTKVNYFKIPMLDNFLAGLFAGGCATLLSHPFEVLRARIQSGTGFIYSRFSEGLRQIYREEGVAGFLKGATPRLARKPLINTTTFMVFETIERVMFQKWLVEQKY